MMMANDGRRKKKIYYGIEWENERRQRKTVKLACFNRRARTDFRCCCCRLLILVRRWSEKSSAQRSTEIISYLLFVKRVDLYMGFRVFFFFSSHSFVGHRQCHCRRCCQYTATHFFTVWDETEQIKRTDSILPSFSGTNTIRLFFFSFLFSYLVFLSRFRCVYGLIIYLLILNVLHNNSLSFNSKQKENKRHFLFVLSSPLIQSKECGRYHRYADHNLKNGYRISQNYPGSMFKYC